MFQKFSISFRGVPRIFRDIPGVSGALQWHSETLQVSREDFRGVPRVLDANLGVLGRYRDFKNVLRNNLRISEAFQHLFELERNFISALKEIS